MTGAVKKKNRFGEVLWDFRELFCLLTLTKVYSFRHCSSLLIFLAHKASQIGIAIFFFLLIILKSECVLTVMFSIYAMEIPKNVKHWKWKLHNNVVCGFDNWVAQRPNGLYCLQANYELSRYPGPDLSQHHPICYTLVNISKLCGKHLTRWNTVEKFDVNFSTVKKIMANFPTTWLW